MGRSDVWHGSCHMTQALFPLSCMEEGSKSKDTAGKAWSSSNDPSSEAGRLLSPWRYKHVFVAQRRQ